MLGQKPYNHPTSASDYYIRPIVLHDRDTGQISAFDKRVTVLDRQLTRQKLSRENALDRTRDVQIVKALDAWAPKTKQEAPIATTDNKKK